MSKRAEDLTGKIFGNLKVLKFHHKERKNSCKGKIQGHRYFWKCKCLLCGNTAIVSSSNLKSLNSTSCGCLTRKRASEANTKHGHANERLYHVWQGMKDRCFNKNNLYFHNYGGRGITVCKEWLDYSNFRKSIMSLGYNENLKRGIQTLERIDVNGNYEPKNCKLIPLSEQCLNKRNSVKISYKGEERTLVEWARLYHIRDCTLRGRIKRGWSIEEALEIPIRLKKDSH